MSSVFSGILGTKSPPPIVMPAAPPSPAPGIGEADAAVKAREAEDAARRRKGRASTILTGSKGAGTPATATKTLLGE